jgi:hypothetical protein
MSATVISFAVFASQPGNLLECVARFMLRYILSLTMHIYSFRDRRKKNWITLENGKTTADAMGDVWRGLGMVWGWWGQPRASGRTCW